MGEMYRIEPDSYEFYHNDVLGDDEIDAVFRWAQMYGIEIGLISRHESGIWHWGDIPIKVTPASE